MGQVHLIVFVVGCLILVAVPRKRQGFCEGESAISGLFLALFLIVGSVVNGFWACLIYNRFYHSADYIFDFIPFWLVTMNANPPKVEGYGTTLTELNAIWFAFAACTWAVTIVLYRLILRKGIGERSRARHYT